MSAIFGLSFRVYPRVCGGTVALPISPDLDMGLSPRVRGNLIHYRRRPAWVGSIPACAGEPEVRLRLASSNRVYPRVCGGTIVAPLG